MADKLVYNAGNNKLVYSTGNKMVYQGVGGTPAPISSTNIGKDGGPDHSFSQVRNNQLPGSFDPGTVDKNKSRIWWKPAGSPNYDSQIWLGGLHFVGDTLSYLEVDLTHTVIGDASIGDLTWSIRYATKPSIGNVREWWTEGTEIGQVTTDQTAYDVSNAAGLGDWEGMHLWAVPLCVVNDTGYPSYTNLSYCQIELSNLQGY